MKNKQTKTAGHAKSSPNLEYHKDLCVCYTETTRQLNDKERFLCLCENSREVTQFSVG